MISAALRKIFWISAGLVLRQVLKAFSAASTARVASAMDADELLQSFSPVDGLLTSKVVEVDTSLPLIQRGTWPEKVSLLAILNAVLKQSNVHSFKYSECLILF